MIKLAFISTVNSLDEISKMGDIEFCVAPYCKDITYKNYFKSSKKYIILDNGIAEDNLIPNNELVDLAVELKVSEVIIPDVIGDYKRTKKMRESFLRKYFLILSENKIKIQSVIQGCNLREYKKCLSELHQDNRVDVIGIPFRMNYTNFINEGKERNCMLNRLFFVNSFQFTKPVHLLGCNLIEEILLFSYNNMRSMDTKLLSRYGINDKIFDLEDEIKPKQKLFIDRYMTKQQIKKTILNINKLRGMLK